MEPEQPQAPLDLAKRRMPREEYIHFLRAVHAETIRRWRSRRASAKSARSLLAEVERRLIAEGHKAPDRPTELGNVV